jgi:phosphohistidine phosphatase SixA
VADPTTILVARHADAEYETRHWADEGGSLSRRGREQSSSLARRLAQRGIGHVYASTYARAVQTAEIAAAHCAVVELETDGPRWTCLARPGAELSSGARPLAGVTTPA